MKYFSSYIFFLFLGQIIYGQTANFSSPTTVCIDQNIDLNNLSTGSTSYVWDFCFDALGNEVETVDFGEFPGLNNPEGITVIYDQGEWHGFLLDDANSKIYRLDFGLGIDSPDPITNATELDQANIPGLVSLPEEIKFIKEGGNWYGLLANLGGNKLSRIDFGNNLSNTPSGGFNIGNLSSWSNIRGLDLVKDGSNVIAIVGDFVGNKATLINFGSSITNALNPPTDVLDIAVGHPLVSQPFGVGLEQDLNGDWYGLLANFGNGKILHMNFGSNLFSNPATDDIKEIGVVSSATGVVLERDGNNYYGIIEGNSSGVYRVTFGNSLGYDPGLSIEQIDTEGKINAGAGLSAVKVTPDWRIFTIESNNKVGRISFSDNCSIPTLLNSTDTEPTGLNYSTAGQYAIELTAFNSGGNTDIVEKIITVTSNQAPDIDFNTTNQCISLTNNFTAINMSGDINAYSWDFDGDGLEDSNLASPDHTYSIVGSYPVTLTVTSTLDCINSVKKTINIYNAPTASFTLPAGSLCSNTSLAFTNTSTYDVASPVSWDWDFNGEGNSTIESPSFTFISGGTKTITLTANLADGCTSNQQEVIILTEGPSVDFDWSNNCFGNTVQFINNSETTNVTYNWDFGDGSQINTGIEPAHAYAIAGDYDVILSVTNLTGCVSSLTKILTVNDQSLVDFDFSGNIENFPVNFTGQELTLPGDNIDSWSWDFDGLGSSIIQSPNFTFSIPGDYSVSLSIITLQGCSEELIKTVTVVEAEKPTSMFATASLLCIEEGLMISNTTVNGVSYLWDFCFDALGNEVGTVELGEFVGLDNPEGITVIYDQGEWHGFLLDDANSKIYRLDFSLGIDSPDPITGATELDQTNIPGLVSLPEQIKFIKEGGNWYGLIANLGGNKLSRIDFGNNLSNTPTGGFNIGNLSSWSNIRGLDLVQDGSNVMAIVGDLVGNKATLVNFGSSITNALNPPTDVLDIAVGHPLVSQPFGVGLEQDLNGDWYGILSNFGNGKVLHMNFGSNLFSDPIINEIGIVNSGTGVSLERDGNSYYGIVVGNTSGVYRVTFGNSLGYDPGLSVEQIDTEGKINAGAGLSAVKTTPDWRIFTIESNNRVGRISFSDNCSIPTISNSTDIEPSGLSYSTAGQYAIELTAFNSGGNTDIAEKFITVTNNQAPSIDFINNNICITNINGFTASSNNDPSILSWNWDFGDGNTASGQNTTHQFLSTGTYPVRLTIDDGTCGNTLVQEISIYDEPIPDFTFPVGIICSNNEISFTNATTGPPDNVITWSWDFNGEGSSNQQDTSFTFLSGGSKTITLTTSIPGCVTEIQKNLNIEAGPAVDFDFADICHTNDMQFTNLTTGSGITTVNWDFGDGNSAVGISDPRNFYINPGTYNATLSVENALGCVNQVSKPVSVHSNPGTDFFSELSCAMDSTQFIDQSLVNNANIAGWEWDFGDPASSANQSSLINPAHLYSEPGNYNVKLVTTSNFGCQDSTILNIEVLPTALADFTWKRNCVMDSVNFHDTSVLANGVNVTDYIWDVDGEMLTGTDPKYQFLTPGIRQVNLSLAFDNFCSVFVSKSIDVAEELLPDFSFGPLCVGQVSEFQDVTVRQADDVIEWLWDINGDTVSTQTGIMNHTFLSTGTQMVSLTVTTANGCDQFVAKNLEVNDVPTPGFETSIEFGAAPLTVDFTNTTQDADLFQWIFQDPNDTRSSARDTTFIFDVLGDYNVTLEATNEFGCTLSDSKLIQVVVPDLEIALENVNLVEENGNLKIVLSITNNGTVTIDEMDILINLGTLNFVESFSGSIIPLESRNYTLDFKIPNLTKEQLEFVCFTLKPLNDSYIESDVSNNEVCINFEGHPLIFDPFPNPVEDQVSISLLIPEMKNVNLRLINSIGESVYEKTVNDVPTGLNTITIETPGFNPGLYLLQVTYEDTYKLFRVVIR